MTAVEVINVHRVGDVDQVIAADPQRTVVVSFLVAIGEFAIGDEVVVLISRAGDGQP